MTAATTDARGALQSDAEQLGWQRKEQDRFDVYRRDDAHVRLLWCGSEQLSGAARYEDYTLLTTTRDLATVRKWLAR